MSYFLVNGIENQIPSGFITAYLGSSDHDGWVLCDGIGRTYDTKYDNVLALSLGTRSGNTYTPPDLRDCIIRGSSNGTTNVRSIVGSNTVTLSTANMPSHTHTLSASGSIPNHTHQIRHTHDYKHVHTLEIQSHNDDFNFKGGGSKNCIDRGTDASTWKDISGQYVFDNPVRNTGSANGGNTSYYTPGSNFTITGNTNSTGTGTALSIEPKSRLINYILKL